MKSEDKCFNRAFLFKNTEGDRQVRDASLRVVDRRRLVLVVGRAPAGDLRYRILSTLYPNVRCLPSPAESYNSSLSIPIIQKTRWCEKRCGLQRTSFTPLRLDIFTYTLEFQNEHWKYRQNSKIQHSGFPARRRSETFSKTSWSSSPSFSSWVAMSFRRLITWRWQGDPSAN